MIRQTRFAVAKKEDKPIYNGICFSLWRRRDNTCRAGRLPPCNQKGKIDFDGSLKFVVPEKTLSEISKLIGDGEEKVKFRWKSATLSLKSAAA